MTRGEKQGGTPSDRRRATPLAGAIEIVRTDDVATVRAFGVANGLDEGEREGKERLGAWEARTATGTLVGGITLERSGGLDIADWMAVDPAYRGRGIASRLLAALEQEARLRGVRRLWITARAPGFFAANGYRAVDSGPEADWLLGECPSCPQYGHGCSPQPMVKDLGAEER